MRNPAQQRGVTLLYVEYQKVLILTTLSLGPNNCEALPYAV